MKKKALRTIQRHRLIEDGEGIVIGLSGGADSAALLRMLCEIKEQYQLKLHAVHINHLFRGENALRDEHFSVALCESYQVPISAYQVDVAAIAREKGISFELAGRDVRYHYFESVRATLDFQKIAVAHHQDDQGETVLMRLIRGSGLEGLAGIRPSRSGGIIRPLLNCSRKEIEAYCEQMGIKPMMDHTNLDNAYSRNFIRNEVMPQINQYFEISFAEKLSKTAERLAEDGDYIQSQLMNEWQQNVEKTELAYCVRKTALLEMHPALRSRLIRKLYETLSGNLLDFEESHVLQILELLKSEGSKRFEFRDVLFKTEYNFLYVTPKNEALQAQSNATLQEKPILTVEKMAGRQTQIEASNHKDGFIFVDEANIVGELSLRHRLPGDKFRPKGMMGHKKLKDFLIDEKIPRETRDQIWILCDAVKIIWICGYRQNQEACVSENTKQILKLTLTDIVTQD